jgi:hypothetical protein
LGIEQGDFAGEIFTDPNVPGRRGLDAGGCAAEGGNGIRADGVGRWIEATDVVGAQRADAIVIQFGEPDVAERIDGELLDVRIGFFELDAPFRDLAGEREVADAGGFAEPEGVVMGDLEEIRRCAGRSLEFEDGAGLRIEKADGGVAGIAEPEGVGRG